MHHPSQENVACHLNVCTKISCAGNDSSFSYISAATSRMDISHHPLSNQKPPKAVSASLFRICVSRKHSSKGQRTCWTVHWRHLTGCVAGLMAPNRNSSSNWGLPTSRLKYNHRESCDKYAILWHLVFPASCRVICSTPTDFGTTLWPEVEETGATQLVLRMRICTFQGGTFRNDSSILLFTRCLVDANISIHGTHKNRYLLQWGFTFLQKNLEICESGLAQSFCVKFWSNYFFHRFAPWNSWVVNSYGRVFN